MADVSQALEALEVLRTARGLIADEKDWTSSGVLCDPEGRVCALGAVARGIGISDAAMKKGAVYDTLEANPAVRALSAAAPSYPGARAWRITDPIWILNDESHHGKVLALFDKAIATLEAELGDPALDPTPNADAALAVLEACESAGAVVARQIVTSNPDLDFENVAEVAASELFYAAQDTAWAFEMGVSPPRPERVEAGS